MERLPLLALALLSMGTSAVAQLEPGLRVRVATKEGRITGTLAAIREGRLELREASWERADAEAPRAISTQEIATLEVWRGQHSQRGAGAWIGAIAGGILGWNYVNSECQKNNCLVAGMLSSVVLGCGAGALAGFGIGGTIKSGPWEAVPPEKLRIVLTPLPGRPGVGLALSLRF